MLSDPEGAIEMVKLGQISIVNGKSQRSMVAARLANLDHGQRQDRQICTSTTVDQAAEMLNVSERSVKTARSVQSTGTPELQETVEQGRAVRRAGQLLEQ